MIDEHGKHHATEPAGIPPHMLAAPTTRAQKKAFAKVKRAEARDDAKADAKAEAKSEGKRSTKKE